MNAYAEIPATGLRFTDVELPIRVLVKENVQKIALSVPVGTGFVLEHDGDVLNVRGVTTPTPSTDSEEHAHPAPQPAQVVEAWVPSGIGIYLFNSPSAEVEDTDGPLTIRLMPQLVADIKVGRVGPCQAYIGRGELEVAEANGENIALIADGPATIRVNSGACEKVTATASRGGQVHYGGKSIDAVIGMSKKGTVRLAAPSNLPQILDDGTGTYLVT